MILVNRFLTLLIAVVFILLCFFLSRDDNYNIISGKTMGTTYEIKYSQSAFSIDQIQTDINDILYNIFI